MKKTYVYILISLLALFIIWKSVEYYNWKNDPFRPLTTDEKNEFDKNSKTSESSVKNEVKNGKEIGCSGLGDESCIDKVRENFVSTGKQILGEEFLGNGIFGISFLDASRGQSYNAKVATDCNCKILNVNISLMR